jgi:hypothetical protein
VDGDIFVPSIDDLDVGRVTFPNGYGGAGIEAVDGQDVLCVVAEPSVGSFLYLLVDKN